MKLCEILNQAKAHAEGITPEEAWRTLGPEIEAALPEVREILQTDYAPEVAQKIWFKVLGNLRQQAQLRKAAS